MVLIRSVCTKIKLNIKTTLISGPVFIGHRGGLIIEVLLDMCFFQCRLSLVYHWLFQYSSCMFCNGFYGKSFGEPVCSTCHMFLFSSDINKQEGEEEVYTEV